MHLKLIRFLCHSSNHAKNRFLPCNIRSLCIVPQPTSGVHSAHSKENGKIDWHRTFNGNAYKIVLIAYWLHQIVNTFKCHHRHIENVIKCPTAIKADSIDMKNVRCRMSRLIVSHYSYLQHLNEISMPAISLKSGVFDNRHIIFVDMTYLRCGRSGRTKKIHYVTKWVSLEIE